MQSVKGMNGVMDFCFIAPFFCSDFTNIRMTGAEKGYLLFWGGFFTFFVSSFARGTQKE